MKIKFRQLLPAALVLGGLLFCACSDGGGKLWSEKKKSAAPPSLLSPQTFVEIVKEQKPAVVNISTTRIVKGHPPISSNPFSYRRRGRMRPYDNNPFEEFFKHFFGDMPRRQFKQKSLGSGFIINKEGYILTNYHVAEDVDEIKVTLANKKEFEAKVVGKDKKTDIALIKIDSWNDLPVVSLGDSDKLQVGEWVLAIGNPFGLEHTVTSGIISATGRVIGSGPYDDYIQTDASINPGNSGGPLFNLKGEVIGINTAIIPEGQGIGFAIPINMVKDILEDLKESGEVTRGWLGLIIQQVTPGLAKSFGLEEPRGALISEVIPDSPADKAGLKQGDVVLSFNGEEIQDYSKLSRLTAGNAPGSKVRLQVLRDGELKTFTVTLGSLPKDESLLYKPRRISSRLGMKVENIGRRLKSYFDLEDDKGVVVTEVQPNSPADEAGITPGTVIISLNRKPVPDLQTYEKILNAARSGETLLLLVKQGMRTHYLTITVP